MSPYLPHITVTFVLDYSPDLETPETRRPSDFRVMFAPDWESHWQQVLGYDSFTGKCEWNDQPWSVDRKRLLDLLDCNGDRNLSDADWKGDSTKSGLLAVSGAEKYIEARVRWYFNS